MLCWRRDSRLRPGLILHVKSRIVIAITGATGAVYGVRLLEALKAVPSVETHLVVSRAGALNIAAELDLGKRDVEALADVVHSDRDIGASIASGSFKTHGMIVAPCSMKTLGALASGVTDTLVSRAADVALKERRRVVLMVRESPLHLVHLRNMVTVTEMGGIVLPPLPVFYAKLESLDDMIDQTVGRVLDLFDVESPRVKRWSGLKDHLGED
jgi:polyprenyl P-hydroxybenzoate/phenylacrylic acid decarboxylase-like protein